MDNIQINVKLLYIDKDELSNDFLNVGYSQMLVVCNSKILSDY